MIKSIINNHKAVVNLGGNLYLNGSVLPIMSVYIQLECSSDTACIYDSLYTFLTVVKLCQNCIINIVVNQNNSPFCRTDKLIDKLMCIEYLTIEQYTFSRRQRGAKEEINLAGQLFYLIIMFRQTPVYPAFHVQ